MKTSHCFVMLQFYSSVIERCYINVSGFCITAFSLPLTSQIKLLDIQASPVHGISKKTPMHQDPIYHYKDLLWRKSIQKNIAQKKSRAKQCATSSLARTDGDALYPCRHEQNRSDLKQKACSDCEVLVKKTVHFLFNSLSPKCFQGLQYQSGKDQTEYAFKG